MEIAKLKSEVQTKEEETEYKLEKEYLEKIKQKDLEITDLQNKIKLQESESSLKLQSTVSSKEQEILTLQNC